MYGKRFMICSKPTDFTDIIPFCVGYQICEAGDNYTHTYDDIYLLQHVISGSGFVVINDKKYNMQKNQTFLIKPGDTGYWQTDDKDLWSYNWVSFRGKKAALLDSVQYPIIDNIDSTLFSDTMNALCYNNIQDLYIASRIMGIVAEILSQKKRLDYVEQIKTLIKCNFEFDIGVDLIAKYIGINKQYMSRLFYKKTNMTVKEYLISVRMREARKLIYDNMRVKEVCYLTGYKDVYAFSRAYKQYFGISPKYDGEEARKAIHATE